MTIKFIIVTGIMLSALMLPPIIQSHAAEPAANINTLSVDEAVEWAFEHSPALRAQQSISQAAKAGVEQAGVLPNPQVSFETENVMGNRPYESFDSAETTYGISQLVEMPGKRSGRVKVAKGESLRSVYETQAAKLDLAQNVKIAFAEAIAARDAVRIREEEKALAQAVYDSVTAKVEAGKEPPIQSTKVHVALSNADIAVARARRAAESRMQTLSALIGGYTPGFTLNTAGNDIAKPEDFAVYKDRLLQTPDYLAAKAEVARADAATRLERAKAVPDPTVNFGVRDFNNTDSQAFVASVSFPIPVFNRNRGAIAQTDHLLHAARMDEQQGVLKREAALTDAYNDFATAYQTSLVLQKEVLPGAEEAFRIARESYEVGKLGYLEVLDAQRTLFAAQQEYNNVQLDYYRAKATVERLTATEQNKED